MASPALQALYEGNVEQANELLPADDALDVFEAAAFGKSLTTWQTPPKPSIFALADALNA